MADGEPREAAVITGEDAVPIPWEEGRRRLAESRFTWVTTVHPSGRPHVRPVLSVWVDGAFHSSSAPSARKGRNLDDDPRCTLSASTDDMDVVVEGRATWVRDEDTLQRVADAYGEKYGWPVTVRDGAFDAPYGAPTAGPPPYAVYRIEPETAFAFATSDELAPRTTRWRF
jgi:nitroimidazol reductase NimA-like FMN-containing flavoprotein (pyridoxamine 5'-phosphate oxidase superfamily)